MEHTLNVELARMSRHGWRVDQRYGAQATVSRPTLWLPTWVHLLLIVPTCMVWAVVWAWMRSTGMRRTSRLVTVLQPGRVTVTSVPSS
jgi:hypothetical protein